MRTDGPAPHESGEKPQRPPRRLLHNAVSGRHERRNDIDALRDARHSQVLALPDEHVEENSHRQRVGQGVALLGSLAALGTHGIPDVPLVKADRRARLIRGYPVFDPSQVDQGGCNLNRTLRSQGCGGVWQMLGRRRVHVNAVHVNKGNRVAV